MSVLTDLQTALENNATAIKEYSARLATDALAPKASYSIDGESVSRNEWRQSLLDAIKGLMEANVAIQQLINGLNPYAIATRVYC